MKRANPYPGLHRAPKRLADGTRKVYFYAWKGGPRLPDAYGSPDFAAAFREAQEARRTPPKTGAVLDLMNAYQRSRGVRRRARGFLDLDERTRRDYADIIRKQLEPEFGDMPLAALADPRVRAVFLDWRDRRAETAPRRADYEFTVLARIFAWALDRRMIFANPCERAGRVWDGSRAENIWTDDQEEQFLKAAPAHLRLAFMLAIWTGQRQGALLRLPWSAYDGEAIRMPHRATSKRAAPVPIPVGAPLKALLDATPRRSPIILTTEDGTPWTGDGFRSSWRKARIKAGIEGVTFNDLRGTAVTRLRGEGCTHAEIGAITGHKNAEINAILEKHYAASDPELARSAIRKLEARRKSPNRLPNRPAGSGSTEGKA